MTSQFLSEINKRVQHGECKNSYSADIMADMCNNQQGDIVSHYPLVKLVHEHCSVEVMETL